MSFSAKGGGLQFFCESCGVEVPRDAQSCPSCGKRFASVRCPSCDFVGGEEFFKNGCPVCGHSPGKASASNEATASDGAARETQKPAGALPVWVYLLTAAAFTAVLAALFLTIAK